MKKMFRILAVTAVLMSLFVISASAVEQPCGGTHDGWTAITSTQQITASGNYYLADNITKYTTVTTDEGDKSNCALDIRANDVTLCLNGHSIKPTTASVIGVRVHNGVTGFKLCNCTQAATDASGNPTSGLVVGHRNRSLLLLSSSVAEVYDNVHLDGNTTIVSNGVVQLNKDAAFTMYGGTINNNVFASSGANLNNQVAALAGLSGTTITLKGGQISGNEITATVGESYTAAVLVNDGTLTIEEGFAISDNVIHAGSYGAGGVIVRGGGQFYMTGGSITGNSCNKTGGAWLSDSKTVENEDGTKTTIYTTLNMSGGEISQNIAGESGGGVMATAKAKLLLSGTGTIADNQANQYGSGVNLSGGTMTMSAGSISRNDLTICSGTAIVQGGVITGEVGTVGVAASAKLTISGGTIVGIVTDKVPHLGMGSHETCTITITGGEFSDDTAKTDLESWLGSGVTLSAITKDGQNYYSAESLSCSGDHSSWTILNAANTLFGYTIGYYENGRSITASGNYYLKANITGSVTANNASYAINVEADDVTLCLDGYSVKPSTSGVAAIRCAGKNLKIITTSSGGTITGNNAVSILVEAGCSVEIGNNVYVNGASITVSEGNVAPIVVNEGGSLTMRGGTISSNTITSTGADSYVGGAILATNATVYLEGGTIGSNTVKQSGTNGYGSGAVTMYGGTLNIGGHMVINGNTTNKNGGAVALYGAGTTFAMSGGTLSNNKAASSGGGVEIADGNVFTMTGGTISGNTGGRWGGGVSIRKGTFNLSNGTIVDNDLNNSTYKYGNQVTVGLYAGSCVGTFNMTGGTVMDTLASTGTNLVTSIDMAVSAGTANIQGGTIAGQVGTVGVPAGASVLKISGGAIHGDVTNAVPLPVDLNDTDTTNDTEDGMEAKRKNCTLTITGGKIYGTVSETSHANRTAKTTTTISGGKFSSATERSVLVSFLTNDQGVLSLLEIAEGSLAYEVAAGLYSTGEFMNYGSSLDLGLYLSADIGTFTENIGNYTISLDGVDDDVTASLSVKEGNLLFMAHGIAAKEMRDDITFTLKNGNDVWFTRTLSIYDAAKTWYEENESMQTMLADMIGYGTQAQKNFGYNTKALLAEPDFAAASASVSGDWTATEGEIVTNGEGARVRMSLSLKEQIQLNFYVYAPQVTLSNVSLDGVALSEDEYTVTQEGSYTCISFHEIPVTKVKGAAQFTATLADSTVFNVNYSIADYVLQEQNGDQGKLMIALQKYVDSVCNFLDA